MRFGLGITSKLFIAVAAISVVIVWAMSGAVGAGFRRDFIEYAMELEQRRIDWVLEDLGCFYAEHGNWDALAADPAAWSRLVRLQAETDCSRHDRDSRDAGNGRTRDGDGAGGDAQTSGADGNGDDRGGGRDDDRGRGGDREGRRRHRDDPDFTGLAARLSLLGLDRSILAGNQDLAPDAVYYPIEAAGGEVAGIGHEGSAVGWLAVGPGTGVIDAVDLQYQERQLHTVRIIGGAAIVAAALIAWLLARIFVGRLQRFARATHQLASGDYGTRVSVSSSDEFARLAEDFNSLARTLEKNEQVRRSFMADMAHELRTPLAVMQAELAAVQDGVRKLTPETVQSLQGEMQMLNKLIDDLYALSLSDTGALTYRKEAIDVAELLDRVLTAARSRFDEAGLEIVVAASKQTLEVLGDPDWLARLFNNLLDNTLRYTDSPGRLEIACRRRAGMAEIELSDSGPGVPDAALARLFERLYRVEPSRSREYGGAGLGLSIASNIVVAHDGTIEAAHSALGGLRITISLPLVHANSMV